MVDNNRAINLKDVIESISYNKSQTYNRNETETLIDNYNFLLIVDELPTSNIRTNKIYLVLNENNSDENSHNRYDFYVYKNEKWEQIDSLEFDISNYPTTEEVDYQLSLKSNINHGHDNVTSSSDGFMSKEDKLRLDTITPSDTNPLMDGSVSQGTSTKYSRQDHKHPSDTSKVDKVQSTASMNLVTDSSKNVVLEAKNMHNHGSIQSNGSISNANSKNVVTDSNGNITTEDKYTHPSYTATTGKPTSNLTPSFGDNVTISQVSSDNKGHVTNNTDRTIKIPDNLGNGTNKGLTTNDYTTTEKNKLNGIEEGANKYVHPSYTNKSSGLYKVTIDNTGHVSGTASPTATDLPSHTHDSGSVKDTSAYGNIGSSANATQKTINDKINTGLGLKANSSDVYSKNETMTSTEIANAIANGVSNVELFEVVSSLPTSNIKGNKFYLTPNNESINQNVYDIYIRVNNKWEQIDSLEFNIEDYYTSDEVDTFLNGKVDNTDSRLSDSRTPKSHSHGNITNTGAVGNVANKPLITSNNGVVTTGSFGTDANTFCQGNDSRLSDTRTPKSHSHGNITNSGAIGTASGKIITTTTNGVLTASDKISKSQISDFPTSLTPTSHSHGDISNDGKIGSTANLPVVTGTSGKLTTGSFESTSSNIKMNGTANTGSLNTFARADHIHPTDTSRASSTHTHGNIANNGTLNNDTASVNKIVVTDSSNNFKTISKLPSDTITHQDISGKVNISDIKDNLTSTDVNKPLSANQGKVLKGLVDGKSASTHGHGNIQSNGTLNSDTTTVGKVVVTDSNNNIKTINKLPLNNVTHQDISGKAPNNHKSTSTTYGVGDTTNYGHVKVDNSMSGSSTNPVQNKVVKDYIDTQVDGIISGDVDLSDTHNHNDLYYTEDEIDTLLNNKVDTTDSRLSDARTPKSHSHGSLTNTGTLNSDITSVNKVAVTDSSNNLKTISKIPFANLNISKTNITGLGIPSQDTTYSTATTSSNGLLSSTDKKKLDGITESADSVSFTQTKTSGIEIGKITINGTSTSLYQQDNNTTYTPASETPLKLVGRTGTIGTSTKYAREDHAHPRYVSYSQSNTTADGYFKLFRVSVGSWCNQPFVFKIIRRGATQEHTYKLRFTNVNTNTTLPTVSSLYNTGDSFDLWVYDNKDKTFDIIVKEPETYFECNVEFYDAMNLAVTDLKTRLTATEFSNLTSTNLTKSTYIGFTSTEKTKLANISNNANNYTHPSYTARTGKPTTNQTPSFGGTATISQITSDNTGHVTGANDFTIKIPDTNASTSAYGITKLYNGVDSQSTTLSATANAVKIAYDKGNHSHNYLPNNANGTTTGTLTATKFINSSSNNTNILLGNGNTITQSTFLKTSTLIPNGTELEHTDLNTYKTPGMYHTDANASMNYMDNAPLDSVAFTMIVYGGNNPTQIATTYHNTNPRTFIRTFNDWANPKWGSWFELSKANHNHDSTYIKNGTGTVTSTNIADKTIVNGDIADGTIESGKIKDGTIVNADISASAGISTSKISGLDTTLNGKENSSNKTSTISSSSTTTQYPNAKAVYDYAQPKVSGKGLSTYDFNENYKTALDNLNTTIANAVSNLEMIEVVPSLPTTNIKTNKLYLKPNSVNGSENKYDFYVRVNNNWEKIDSLDFSISDYIKKDSNTNLLLSNGATKPQSDFATSTHNHSGTYVDGAGTKNTTNGSAIAEIKANTTLKGTIYHPKVLSSNVSSGLYKIAVNTDGHITGTASVNASDLPSSIPTSKITGLSSVATSGSYKDLSNKPSFTQDSNITSSTSGRYAIGTLNLDGTNNVTLYAKDTNTTYSADESTLTKSSGNVFSLKDSSNYVKKSSTAGYLKNDGTVGTPTNTTYSKGDGLLLSNNTFSADFGTGNKQVARGDHTHNNYLTSVATSNITNNAVTLAKLNSDVYDTTNGGTSGSSKLITSNAVYNALNNVTTHTLTHFVNKTINGQTYAFTANSLIRLDKIGKLVICNVHLEPTDLPKSQETTSAIPVCYVADGVPEGFRPNSYIVQGWVNSTSSGTISFNTDGSIVCNNVGAKTSNLVLANVIWVTP